MFLKNNTYGKGRTPGSRNKLPNRELICQVVEELLADLQANQDTLTIDEKIRILAIFKNLYSPMFFTDSGMLPDNEIKVTIISANE
jgi:hypothetical protein